MGEFITKNGDGSSVVLPTNRHHSEIDVPRFGFADISIAEDADGPMKDQQSELSQNIDEEQGNCNEPEPMPVLNLKVPNKVNRVMQEEESDPSENESPIPIKRASVFGNYHIGKAMSHDIDTMTDKTIRKMSGTVGEGNRASHFMRLAIADALLAPIMKRKHRDARRKSSLLIEWSEKRGNRMSIDRVSYEDDDDGEDIEPDDRKSVEWREAIERCIGHPLPQVLMLLVTVYALCGEDLKLLFFPPEDDVVFMWLNVAALIIFSVELALTAYARKDYFGSLIFWLDVISTVSILTDIEPVWSSFAAADSSDGVD